MWIWRRLRSATLCRASLRCGGARGAVCGRKLARSSQNGWRMALYLEGKTSVDTNELSPKEATQMSYDVKYIGMDVHKEAIVIAVLNEGGKLVMESVIETKASSILQFLHGLRGELHVTWEEGTWAAWLYDLLQPQVQHIVVCNPRRNALLLQTPHRFRTKRQLWAYSGFAVETHDSGEYRFVRGKPARNRERITVRGLNHNHNHDLKNLFKGAAISASTRPGPLCDFYVALVEKGMRPTMARLTLARKMAAITLTIWKKGVEFDAKQLHRQAA